MLTLNNIKHKLLDIFNNHPQLHSVVYSDEFSFSAERNLVYPVANIEYLESSINNKLVIHSFNIKIGDLVHAEKLEFEDEIYSDLLLVAEDLLSLIDEVEGFTLIKTSSIQKFSDENGDRVSGLTFRINLQVVRTQNVCIVPTA